MAKKKKNDRFTKLAKAAQELNKVLGLEPPIATAETTEAELEEKLQEAVELIAPEDEFTKGTEAILAEFTDEDFDEEEPEDGDDDESEEDDFEEDDEDSADEPEEEDMTLEEIEEVVRSTKKRKDLRVFAEELDDVFDAVIKDLPNLKTAKALRGAMLDRLDELAEGDSVDEPDETDETDEKPAKKSKKKPAEKKAAKKPAKKSKKKPAKKSKKKAAEKEADKPEKKKSMTQQTREFLYPLLEKGGHSQKELREMAVEEGCTKSTASTIISDSKNPDYNKFDRLVVEDEDGNLKFEEG